MRKLKFSPQENEGNKKYYIYVQDKYGTVKNSTWKATFVSIWMVRETLKIREYEYELAKFIPPVDDLKKRQRRRLVSDWDCLSSLNFRKL